MHVRARGLAVWPQGGIQEVPPCVSADGLVVGGGGGLFRGLKTLKSKNKQPKPDDAETKVLGQELCGALQRISLQQADDHVHPS